jgi:hypothetical protein
MQVVLSNYAAVFRRGCCKGNKLHRIAMSLAGAPGPRAKFNAEATNLSNEIWLRGPGAPATVITTDRG